MKITIDPGKLKGKPLPSTHEELGAVLLEEARHVHRSALAEEQESSLAAMTAFLDKAYENYDFDSLDERAVEKFSRVVTDLFTFWTLLAGRRVAKAMEMDPADLREREVRMLAGLREDDPETDADPDVVIDRVMGADKCESDTCYIHLYHKKGTGTQKQKTPRPVMIVPRNIHNC